jgi:hypothetical protein
LYPNNNNFQVDYNQAYQGEDWFGLTEEQTRYLVIGGVVTLAVLWFLIEATECWDKPVGEMPGWCLTAPIFGIRGSSNRSGFW